jgi:hypothetical protein
VERCLLHFSLLSTYSFNNTYTRTHLQREAVVERQEVPRQRRRQVGQVDGARADERGRLRERGLVLVARPVLLPDAQVCGSVRRVGDVKVKMVGGNGGYVFCCWGMGGCREGADGCGCVPRLAALTTPFFPPSFSSSFRSATPSFPPQPTHARTHAHSTIRRRYLGGATGSRSASSSDKS